MYVFIHTNLLIFSCQFEKWFVGQLLGNHQLIDFDLIDV